MRGEMSHSENTLCFNEIHLKQDQKHRKITKSKDQKVVKRSQKKCYSLLMKHSFQNFHILFTSILFSHTLMLNS